MKSDDFVMMPIPTSRFAAVCALLAGASAIAHVPDAVSITDAAARNLASPPAPQGTATVASEPAAEASIADDGTVDAAGWPWSADMHASTKGMTKEGLWRMKVGVLRPGAKPGFPKDSPQTGATGTPDIGTTVQPSDTATNAPATSTDDDDDEFAAFRDAANKANGADEAAVSTVPARKWTDADLGALCNQAAVKLGDPAPIKALIAEFCPEGVVPHSRNIPDAERENFAQSVELKAGIEFAG